MHANQTYVYHLIHAATVMWQPLRLLTHRVLLASWFSYHSPMGVPLLPWSLCRVTLMGQSLRIGRPKGFEQAIANNPQMAALAAGGKPPAAGLGMGAAALPGMGMPGMTGLAGMGGMGGMMGMNPMQLMGMMSMAGLSTAMTGTAGVPGVGGLTGLASTAAGTTAMGGAGVPGTATTAAVTSSGAKLRIMNAPATLDADILLSMVAPFGPVKAHRKCAGPSADAHFFDFEYEDPATGKVALPALNDLSIGPVKLKVVLLPDNIQIGSSTTDAAAATTTAAATTGAVANPAADPAHPANKPPTCTLKLQNMVTDEEVRADLKKQLSPCPSLPPTLCAVSLLQIFMTTP